MSFYSKLFATAGLGFSLGFGSVTATAGLLDYNLALTGDLTGAVHVEGMSFVGGNLVSTQMSDSTIKTSPRKARLTVWKWRAMSVVR